MKMDDDLTKQLEFLKILALMERWSAYIVKAEKEKMGHEKFLRYVISESYAARITFCQEDTHHPCLDSRGADHVDVLL